MPEAEHVINLLVDFEKDSGQLRLRTIAKNPYTRMDVSLDCDKDKLISNCQKYWEFVDDAVSSGTLTQLGPDKIKAFYDDLVTWGTKLTKSLLNNRGRDKLWTLAGQSTVLVIITDLLFVPWEALFDPETRSFLSDHCVVVRWPEDTKDHTHDLVESDFSKRRILFLDPVLAEDKVLKIGAMGIHDYLKGRFGEDLQLTTLKGELVRCVKSVRLVQWICEHAIDGLRIAEGVFYSEDDSDAHRFPQGSVLILTSCKSGASKQSAQSVAAAICLASHCTVIAPSSVVATLVGVRFAHKIDEMISTAGQQMTVVEMWRNIRVTHREIESKKVEIEPEMCFVRWYGIYGNGDALLN